MTAFTPGLTNIARSADGVVTVGREARQSVMRQRVGLMGAELIVDLERLDAVPTLRIADVQAASWWIAHVLGESVARAVLDGAADDGESGDNARAIAEPGALAAPVLRFAVGLWLHRWWPSGRDGLEELGDEREQWLETELGILAWFADQAFGGHGTATQLLEENIDHVLRFAQNSRDRIRPIAALRAVIECVPLNDERYDELSGMERLLSSAAEIAAATEFDDALQGLPRFTERPVKVRLALSALGGASSQRATDFTELSGTSSVDWARVPPRIVSGDEASVHWSIGPADADGRARISVSVPVGTRWRGDAVHAAVYRNGATRPEVVLALEPHPAASPTGLVGHASCSAAVPGDDFRAEVFSAEWLESDEPSVGRHRDRVRIVERIEALLATRADVDNDAAPYDLQPGEWPWPPKRATWESA